MEKGDVVGCGIHLGRREIFFTRNGKHLGVAFEDVDLSIDLFPTVSLHGIGEVVRCNFGQSAFAYDAGELLAEDERAESAAIDEKAVPVSRADDLVRQYLEHYGYQDTLEALVPLNSADSTKSDANGHSSERSALGNRKRVRKLVQSGDILGAMAMVEELYPGLLESPSSSDTLFQLHCQQFLELVKSGETLAAVAYARTQLNPLCGPHNADDVDPEKAAYLEKVMGSLAYAQLGDAPGDVAELLSDEQRELTADCVNAAMLRAESAGCAPTSTLERALCHLICTRDVARAVRGGKGEIFALRAPSFNPSFVNDGA